MGLFLGVLIATKLPSLPYLAPLSVWTRNIWKVVVIAEITYLAYHLLNLILVWYLENLVARTETKVDDRLLPLIRRILPILVYSFGVLAALTSLSIPISPVWAGLGIGGLAIALAVQPVLSNFFAGTFVITDGEIDIGDYIELENGPAGYVVGIDWRTTRIRTWLNNLVIIPNSKMAETPIYNYYKPVPAVNVLVYCGVSYDSDLDKVEEVVLDECQKLIDRSEYAVKDVEPWFAFEEFGESNITFWAFLQATDRIGGFVLTSEVIKSIRRRLRDEGIEINYPMRKLVMPSTNGRMSVVPQMTNVESPTGREGDG